MAKFKDFPEQNFKCDSCKKTFKGRAIVLKPAAGNITMVNPQCVFKFVDKDGTIQGGYKGPDGSIGDQVLHCPLCDHTHLFGMDIA